MSFLAWTLAYLIKQNGYLSKILEETPQTIGQCKQAVAALIIIDSAFLLSKNKDIAASLYLILRFYFQRTRISLLRYIKSNQNGLRKN